MLHLVAVHLHKGGANEMFPCLYIFAYRFGQQCGYHHRQRVKDEDGGLY